MYKNIKEAMQGLSVWKKNSRNKIAPLVKNIAYKPTFHADTYREAAFRRFIELTESAYFLFNNNQMVGAIVVARAAQETLAILWYLNTKLEHLSKTKDLKHFTETLRRLTIAWTNDDEFPEKINILTMIDAVDKKLEGAFRRHYEMLSEYAHPNYSGTFGAYAIPDKENLEVSYSWNYPRSKKTLTTHLESTLIICIELLEAIQEKYETVINDALDVCLELHEKGELVDKLK